MAARGSGRDLTGLTFGKLTALDCIRNGNDRLWRCQCQCGAQRYVVTGSLTAGKTRSCGCAPHRRSGLPRKVKTHGQARHGGEMTRTYSIWRKMRARCGNSNDTHYARYGGRGIRVCEPWKKFVQFWQDMGDCPPHMEIDRLDNDGHYEPDNCRWATRKEQNRNKSDNRMLTLNGITRCVTDWAESIGIQRGTISSRLRYGWSVERTLTEPVDHRKTRQLKGP